MLITYLDFVVCYNLYPTFLRSQSQKLKLGMKFTCLECSKIDESNSL